MTNAERYLEIILNAWAVSQKRGVPLVLDPTFVEQAKQALQSEKEQQDGPN